MTPKKKDPPQSLVRAVDTGAPVRPVTPVRRRALPLGVAAAFVLAAGGGVAYASASRGARVDDSSDTLRRMADFIAPDVAHPRLAGEVAVPAPAPVSSQGSIPVPPHDPPVTKVPIATPPIVPQHVVPRTAGVMPVPHHIQNNPSAGTTL